MKFYYLFFAVLGLTAIFNRFLTTFPDILLFLSYFTMLSNILAVGIFFYLGFNEKTDKNIDVFRGAVTLYMCITGLVVYFILSKYPLTIPVWVNMIVHQIMPIAVFVAWVLVPLQKKLNYSLTFYWLIFPLGFAIYTLIRGSFIHWYPYPFLNPTFGGYSQVLLNVVILIFCSWFLALLLVFIANKRASKFWSY